MKRNVILLLVVAIMMFGLAMVTCAAEPDPGGIKTGGVSDVVGASANAPTADDLKNLATNEPLAVKLADVVGHNRIAINFVWLLVCGFLVCLCKWVLQCARQALRGPKMQAIPWP